MGEIKLFEFEEFSVRSVTIDGEPWFVAKDVASSLGYSDTSQTVRKLVDDEDKRRFSRTEGVSFLDAFDSRVNNLVFINESGVYSLIFGSRLESAKKFKRWVTKEVLPSIRRDGAYFDEKRLLEDQAALDRTTDRLEGIVARKAFADVLNDAYRTGVPTSASLGIWAANFTKMMTKKTLGLTEAEFKERKSVTGNFRDSATPQELRTLEAAEMVVVSRYKKHGIQGIKDLYKDAKSSMDVFN